MKISSFTGLRTAAASSSWKDTVIGKVSKYIKGCFCAVSFHEGMPSITYSETNKSFTSWPLIKSNSTGVAYKAQSPTQIVNCYAFEISLSLPAVKTSTWVSMTKENSFSTFLQEMGERTLFLGKARLEKDLAQRISHHHCSLSNLYFKYWKTCCSVPVLSVWTDRQTSSESEPQAKSVGHGIELQI